MVAAVAGIGLFRKATSLQRFLREDEPERMAVGVAGLADTRHTWHVAADTASESMDSMNGAPLR